jgi:hypothetical protein
MTNEVPYSSDQYERTAMLPSWADTSVGGTKIRVALWLLSEVGEGNTFTKAQLRDAFPQVEQVDRRMRDLRDHSWKIATNKEDASLTPNELRFVKAGEKVWEPGKSSPSMTTISNKQRMAVIAGDDYMCVVCGIAGGETYPDSAHGETAQLSVSRRSMAGPDGRTSTQYVTECKRCKAGASPQTMPSLEVVLSGIAALSPRDREVLASWVSRDRRQPRRVDQLWSEYRRLPAESREVVAEHLRRVP